MAQPQFPFQPLSGNAPATAAAVTTSAAQLTLPAVPSDGAQMRITIDGNQRVSWAYGNVPVNITTGVLMLANTVEVFDVPGGTTQISHNAPAAGSNISVCIGRGF